MLTLSNLNPKYHRLWSDVADYFEDTGKDAINLITASRVEGQKRLPQKYDIFVHPQFPFSTDARTSVDVLDRYKLLINEAISSARNPLFVTYLEGSRDWPDLVIPEEREVSSIPYRFQTTGAIASSTLERFLTLLGGIHPEDQFRIHGAALGCCPTEFAIQLYGLVYAGQFWPDIPDDEKSEENEGYCVDQALTQLLVDNSLLTKSKIRYGVVHDSNKRLNVLLDSRFLKPETISLIDEKTVIVPYERDEIFKRISAITFVAPSS